MRPKMPVFSSGLTSGEPCMVTGIYKSDDLSEYLQQNPEFHKMMNYDIR
jgi:hypothetical protein